MAKEHLNITGTLLTTACIFLFIAFVLRTVFGITFGLPAVEPKAVDEDDDE